MGSYEVIGEIFRNLPPEYTTPIILVRHIGASHHDNFFVNSLNDNCLLRVKEADQLEAITAGHIYIAPANYHLLVERDRTLSLSIDPPVKFSRPSIDVLFESAAKSYGPELIGVILSGANSDGTAGFRRISECGGYTIAQDPESAEVSAMPMSAISSCKVTSILPSGNIAEILTALTVD